MEQNQIKLAVFDWAGTTVDYGSSAPAVVFERTFAAKSIRFTRPEINAFMGMEKKGHIRSLLATESGSSQFRRVFGRDWTENDVEDFYQAFEANLFDVVAEYSAPISGTVEAVRALRDMGIKIGSTTGYTSQMMERVLPAAEKGGYVPDCVVTPDIAGAARPSPFMLFECMKRLNVYPPRLVVKVGDTVIDMEEGVNAGAWSIGIITGSNLLGLTEDEYDAMPAQELAARKKAVEGKRLWSVPSFRCWRRMAGRFSDLSAGRTTSIPCSTARFLGSPLITWTAFSRIRPPFPIFLAVMDVRKGRKRVPLPFWKG